MSSLILKLGFPVKPIMTTARGSFKYKDPYTKTKYYQEVSTQLCTEQSRKQSYSTVLITSQRGIWDLSPRVSMIVSLARDAYTRSAHDGTSQRYSRSTFHHIIINLSRIYVIAALKGQHSHLVCILKTILWFWRSHRYDICTAGDNSIYHIKV